MSNLPRKGVIIGANAGIGRATAHRLHRDGYALVVADLPGGGLRDLAAILDSQAECVDVADAGALAHFAEACGDVDALVLAAGLSASMGPFDRLLAVNLCGTAAALQALEPRLREGGAVICLASIAGHLAPPLTPSLQAVLEAPLDPDLPGRLAAALAPEQATAGMAYTLSKVGVLRLVARKAEILGQRGVRICSVSPGPIDTPMGVAERKARPQAYAPLEFAPVPRLGRAEEVADVIAFLCSRQASYVTGSDILVDGGWVASARSSPRESAFMQALGLG